MAETPQINPASLYGAVDLSSLVQRANAPAASAPAGPGGAPSAEGQPPAGEPVATLPDAVVDADEQTLEQFMQLSQFLPVIVEMHAAWSSDAQALSPVLASIIRSAEGRLVLVRVDLDAHPQLGQQPQVIAIIGGRPLQLFSGNPPREQITQIIGEILQVSAQQGLTGFVKIDGDGAPNGDADAAPAEPPLPPLHAEAFEALERGDYAAAADAYGRAIAERPADDEAKAGLAQVQLLQRLQGKTLDEIRQRAAAAPDELEAQLDVADLDLSGGHIGDAFDRLLTLFPKLDAEGKTAVRERLLELFLVVGAADPRVGPARSRLTSLLF